MNILIPDSWLREYLDTDATPQQIQEDLSLCGPSVERLISAGSDFIYDIEVTTNRVDCMSILGIAREAAAILPEFGHPAKLISDPLSTPPKLATVTQVDYLSVKLDPYLCPRFSAVLIRGVTVKPSPPDLAAKLTKAGLRPINNLIDVTNLLMHELGQPLHVFDYDKISGRQMVLRASRPGETLTTLDHKTHTLPGGDIVIADGSGELIDLCGIMGGLNSSVTDTTRNVLLFVQTYAKNPIRATSMALGHRTAAAVLFEKGLPTEQVLPVLKIASRLITRLAGGKIAASVLDRLFAPETPATLTLTTPLHTLASRLMGVPVNSSQTADILKRLNFHLSSQTSVRIPFYRKFDITIPEDLVEEIARLVGYHNLPPVLMAGELPSPRPDRTFYWENRIKTALKYFGFTEVYSYSLIPDGPGLRLKNPLSEEWVCLRTELNSSHHRLLYQNSGRADVLNFFEIAHVYLPRPGRLPEEQMRLIVSTNNSDYSFIKGVCETLLLDLGITNFPPAIQSLPDMLYWEIPTSEILSRATDKKTYRPISKFTPIIEDINLPHTGKYSDLINKIKSVSPLISTVSLVDNYQNKLTLRLTFHSPDRQLSNADVAPLRSKLQSIS